MFVGHMRARALVSLLLLIVALTVSGLSATAQSQRAVVRGVVLDPAGAPAPNIEMRFISEATGAGRRVASDDQGRYVAAELEPGAYRIEVEGGKYRAFAARVEVAVNQDLRLDLPLALATASTSVDVRAVFLPVERDSPALTTRLDNRLITELPLDGRNFLELSLLAPGTVPAPQGSAASVRGDFSFAVNGAREDFNNYLLDGIYNVDPKLGTVGVRPPVDAIREFEVRTSTYDATFGRNAGGQVNIVTRSGSNRTSGAAYEFFRGGAFDAHNYFAPKDEDAPEYNRHQFGAAVGGPIVKNRTFFFVDYEGTRLREGVTRVTNVPTLAEREGDFSQSLFARPNVPGTAIPFPGGMIPLPFQDPRGRAIAALFPDPNRNMPFANFVSSPTLEDDIHQFDARLDQSVRNGSRLTVRYSLSDRSLFEPFAGTGFSLLPGYGNDVTRRGQNLLAAYTYAPSSSLVHDIRFGYNRVHIDVVPADTSITNASVGMPSLSSNPRDAGLSLMSIAGFSPLGPEYNNPQASTSNTFQLTDTATWTRGAHLVKFGAEWYGVRQSAFRDVQARGFLNFIDQYLTGNALADLLLGFPVTTGGATLDNPQNLRTNNWSVFAHDDWRATPALTVSAGLRYDYSSPPVDKDDRANLYDVETGQLVPVGTNGMPRGGYDPDRNNLAPRIGFAWTANSDASMAVRGGYGIYYNQGALATSEGLYFNPPYFNLNVYFPFASAGGPGGAPTLADPFPADFPIQVPQSATAYQRDLQTPWMEHWNLTLQRNIGRSRTFEISYVGSRGHDLISARDVNQPPASPSPFNFRPNPAFADITLIESRATSRYNAMQLRYQQRSESSLSVLATYTYGKSTDDASGFFTSAGDANFPQNSLDPGAEEGRSSFDIRHKLATAFSWPLPFGEGRRWVTGGMAGKILSEMELHGVYMFQSGRPFTVALLPDDRRQQHGTLEPRVRVQRPSERDRRPHRLQAVSRAVVQHRGLFVPRVRHLRQRAAQLPRRPGLQERERGAGEERDVRPALAAATARRSLQHLQPRQLRPARFVPRLTDVRPDPVRRVATQVPVRREVHVLTEVGPTFRSGAFEPPTQLFGHARPEGRAYFPMANRCLLPRM